MNSSLFNKNSLRLSECVIFFDFDNTITKSDLLDDIIKRFSVNEDWMRLERLWKAGKIGSKECLRSQLKQVRVTKRSILHYLATRKLDPYAIKLIALLKEKGVNPVILSDSFSFIIKAVLKFNGIKGIKVYANQVSFKDDRLIASFPYMNGCARCAHCKKQHLLPNLVGNKNTIYVGDGLSDICPAKVANIVFAKDELLSFLRKEKRDCIAFKNLKDIYCYLKRLN